MKILWHSNAPWAATGYGQQTQVFAPRLAEAGHDVAVSAFYGLNGSRLEWLGLPVYPGGTDMYGNDVVMAHAAQFFEGEIDSGLILTLTDTWVLDAERLSRANVASWTPVDHDPVPPKVAKFFERSGAIPIAMSKFGEKALRAVGLDPLYVPHGVDRKELYPEPVELAREQLGIPKDKFVVGMVAANKGTPSRKAIPEALRAFKTLHDKHDDAMLYLHMEATGVMQGVNVNALLAQLEIPPEAVMFVNQYQHVVLGVAPVGMRLAYSAMDVLLNPSYGEGFGVPIIEAQACGTPVIVNNCTAMTELAGAGWMVSSQPSWTYQSSWQFAPNIERIEWALNEAYESRTKASLHNAAVAFAAEYDAEKVLTDYWIPALTEIARRISAPAPEADEQIEVVTPDLILPPGVKVDPEITQAKGAA